jgi:hypothetical protein
MIYSSVNLDRFITAPQVLGVIISKSRWLENIRTGHLSYIITTETIYRNTIPNPTPGGPVFAGAVMLNYGASLLL